MTSVYHFGILCNMKRFAILYITYTRNFAVFLSRSLIKLLRAFFCVSFYIIIRIIIYMILSCNIQFWINGFLPGLRRAALIQRCITIHLVIFCIPPGPVILCIFNLSCNMKRRTVWYLLIIQLRRIKIRLWIKINSSCLWFHDHIIVCAVIRFCLTCLHICHDIDTHKQSHQNDQKTLCQFLHFIFSPSLRISSLFFLKLYLFEILNLSYHRHSTMIILFCHKKEIKNWCFSTQKKSCHHSDSLHPYSNSS